MNIIKYPIFLLLSLFSLNALGAQVTGVIDGIYNGSTIKGWACVTTQTKSIPVHIYVGGQAGVGVALAVDSASDYSETAVDNACKHSGVRARHRFSYTFSEAQKSKYQGQKIYVHGIGSGVPNQLLARSGNFIMPKPKPKSKVIGIIDGIYNDTTIKGWACVTTQTKSIPVHIYVGGQVGLGVGLAPDSASDDSETAVDNACKHSGIRGRHRFSYTFSEAQKRKYQGQKIYVHGIGSGVTNRLLDGSGEIIMPAPKSVSIGVIDDPEGEDVIKGWACIKGQTDGVTVDIFSGGKLIKSVFANMPDESAEGAQEIARKCGHAGLPGNHRFYVSLNNQETMAHGGKKLSARIRETFKWLSGHLRYDAPSDVEYLFAVHESGAKSADGLSDEVSLEWDYLSTKDCPAIKATVISFPGGGGDSHDKARKSVKKVEKVLGQNGRCVRLIRANVNPGRHRPGGAEDQKGYWLRNDNFNDAATLMTDIIEQAHSEWVDLAGEHPSQGKIIVAGSSAGSMVAAAALEQQLPYYELVDRTIMISGPLGVDISRECGLMKNIPIKKWLDSIFDTGTACNDRQCELLEDCLNDPGDDKDVVDIANHNRRGYLPVGGALSAHEIAILVGSADPLGCKGGNIDDECGDWNAAEAASRYTESISGYESVFKNSGVADHNEPYTKYVIAGGTHDLWDSSEARRLICKNALSEAGGDESACDGL